MMGEIRMLHKHTKCINCGKTFLQVRKNLDLCPDCMKDAEAHFRVVKDYLYDYPGATAKEIARETGVGEDLILKWYDQGRLEKSDVTPTAKCEICGRSILAGRICKRCQEDMKSGFGGSSTQENKVKRPAMHIAEKRK
jgi:predicted amidophosphoribosyltransferase